MGGSIALALRRRRVSRRIVGMDRQASVVGQARRRGAIDAGGTSLRDAVAGAELVILPTPPSTVVPLAQQVADATTGRVLITDTASAKVPIVAGWTRALPARIQAVGSHPMAGSEQSGFNAASSTDRKSVV